MITMQDLLHGGRDNTETVVLMKAVRSRGTQVSRCKRDVVADATMESEEPVEAQRVSSGPLDHGPNTLGGRTGCCR